MKALVVSIENRDPILVPLCLTGLEGLVQDCWLNAVGPRPLVLVSRISEGSACQLFRVETIVTFLRIIHSLWKGIWEALRSEVITKADLILKVFEVLCGRFYHSICVLIKI